MTLKASWTSKPTAACALAVVLISMPCAADSGKVALETPMLGTRSGLKSQHPSYLEQGIKALDARQYEDALAKFDLALATTQPRQAPLVWLKAQFQTFEVLNHLGRKAEALERARQMTETCERELGLDDPVTSDALEHLGFLLRKNGRMADAEPIYTRNLAQLEAKHGEDSYFTARARVRLANLLMEMGRLPEAEDLHRAALRSAQDALDEHDPELCFYLTHCGYCLHLQSRKKEAATLMNQAYCIMEHTGAGRLSSPGSTLRRQAEFFLRTGQITRADKAARLCYERLLNKRDTDRGRFFYLEQVRELYHAILVKEGLKPGQARAQLEEMEMAARGR